MKREEFAAKIHWPSIIWLAGIANILAMLPQLYTILTTWTVKGLNLGMFVAYGLIQVAFSLQGFFRRDKMLMVCMLLSAMVSASVIGLILYIR